MPTRPCEPHGTAASQGWRGARETHLGRSEKHDTGLRLSRRSGPVPSEMILSLQVRIQPGHQRNRGGA